MIERELRTALERALKKFPVVGLVGARQVGKTTLAKAIAGQRSRAVYLDLELPSDLAKLERAELYLDQHLRSNTLVILDEVQRMPELFPILRALVDRRRRNGRFLILGSASPDLARQSNESLAGRVEYLELTPLNDREVAAADHRKLWRRGGYPPSFLARSERGSLDWRRAFIQAHLERDIPNLGFRVPATALRRFWTMLAHVHGQLWNASKIAESLGASPPTTRHYLDILNDTFMLRALPPYFANVKKRLVKSPKVFLRDSGLLHSLLRLESLDDVLAHPVAGASWEGFVVEQVVAGMPRSWGASFYRTAAGAEVDLVLERTGRKKPIAVEVKLSLAPTPSRGFWNALDDIQPSRAYIVYPGAERYPLQKSVFALPFSQLNDVWSP